MNRKISYILITVVAAFVMALSSCSKKVTTYSEPVNKTAFVSQDSAYIDTIQLPFDSKGVDIAVKMEFDEPSNVLTLTVKGTRRVFVFRDDTYYKKVFHNRFLGMSVMRPLKLSYPVLVQPGTKVYLSKNVKKSFASPARKHMFNNWLGEFSKNFSLVVPALTSDDPTETALVCDSIVQRFNVDPNATQGTIKLRNLLVIDKLSEKPLPKKAAAALGAVMAAAKTNAAMLKTTKPAKWIISNDKDINTTYNIRLLRNPCFGLEAEKDSTLDRLFDIMNAYHNLVSSCPGGTVESKAALQVFRQHKYFLRSQFKHCTDSSACTEIQSNITEYNKYVDSIRNAQCTYVPPIDQTAIGSKVLGTGVSPQYLLDTAHRVDNIVAQYTLATDAAQIHDLIISGHEIIRLMNRTIKEKGIRNDNQRSALAEFRKAEAYFNRVVLRQ